MAKKELYYFATDALLKVATEDPACVPLRLFFDRQVHVLTTQQCYHEAYRLYAQHHIVEKRAEAHFKTYLDKVEVLSAAGGASGIEQLMARYSLHEAGASLIAAIKEDVQRSDDRQSLRYLVTSSNDLIAAAKKENIDFHDYSEEEFCSKYGS